MRIDPTDPRITAYILGELEDDERAAIEAELEQCAESRAFVDELRALSEELGAELGAADDEHELPVLDPARKAALEARIDESRANTDTDATDQQKDTGEVHDLKAARLKKNSRLGWWIGGGVAAAAAVLLVIGLGSTMLLGKAQPFALESAPRHRGPEGKMGKRAASRTLRTFDRERPKASHDPRSRTVAVGKPAGATSSTDRYARNARRRFAAKSGALKLGKGQGRGLDSLTTGTDKSKRGAKEGEKTPADTQMDRDGDGAGESYRRLPENPFRLAKKAPLSTFSIDVDTASYSNMRRFLRRNTLPPAGSLRIEELVNYFDYTYEPPRDGRPFAVHLARARAPWNPRHQLLRVALKGKVIATDKRPPSNLVFLLDVSGSMSSRNKLPLLRRGFSKLVRRLGENDRVAIAVYAGASGLVLPSTPCTAKNRRKILSALERLQAGGSTNGGAGIELAYNIAVQNYIKGGVNRVILATDGDFNVGTRSRRALEALIKRKAKSNVFLTVLGFGMGNYKDSTLETLANKGNGSYAYIDTDAEARKVLVDQLSGTLVTIAKDVKIQLEMNPAKIAAYRLIGYENRMLAARDFADDKKDAGEIGAGHTVTALYELVPVGVKLPKGLADGRPAPKLRYSAPGKPTTAASAELLTVKLRYKKPEGSKSTLLKLPLTAEAVTLDRTDADFRFAAAVAWFGMVLRGSRHLPASARTLTRAASLAREGLGSDRHGYRKEFLELVRRARTLRRGR